MGLQQSYTLLAPLYDFFIARVTKPARQKSLQQLSAKPGEHILISGIGSGLDIPLLPNGPHYHGVDITLAMLERAQHYSRSDLSLYQGDVMRLPFPSQRFDHVIMHLILAVVPDPLQALKEAERILKPGGHIFILDKFIPPERPAPLRRLISPLTGMVATPLDVVFEALLPHCPSLKLVNNKPALFNGWFRMITLEKA
ncbi:MAG: class I SAM-dependent methyltransferase [Gammaproteobacteria bacterium]|nr:class I SAM-dependent methyltransferase [Gammaproteobacteria bacterium]